MLLTAQPTFFLIADIVVLPGVRSRRSHLGGHVHGVRCERLQHSSKMPDSLPESWMLPPLPDSAVVAPGRKAQKMAAIRLITKELCKGASREV
jgi:hypothetical protein